MTKKAKEGFSIYKDTVGKFRWRVINGTGAVLGTSRRGYNTRQSAKKSATATADAILAV